MKSLETVVAVTHTSILDKEIARNSKAFNVLKNRRNLEYSQYLIMIIF